MVVGAGVQACPLFAAVTNLRNTITVLGVIYHNPDIYEDLDNLSRAIEATIEALAETEMEEPKHKDILPCNYCSSSMIFDGKWLWNRRHLGVKDEA